MKTKTKNVQIIRKTFEFKADTISDGEFTGYAAIFGNVDLGGDVIQHGAFKRTIDHSNGRVPVLWQHNTNYPIGDGLEMSEDEKGLWVKATLNTEMQTGKDALSYLKAGVANKSPRGLSIGYDIVQDSWDRTTGIHYLIELRLWEYSIATFPMNPVARVDNAKNYLYNADDFVDSELNYLIAEASKISDAMKAGRILSQANYNIVRDAISALTALLEAASVDDSGKSIKKPADSSIGNDLLVPASEWRKLLHDMQIHTVINS